MTVVLESTLSQNNFHLFMLPLSLQIHFFEFRHLSNNFDPRTFN